MNQRGERLYYPIGPTASWEATGCDICGAHTYPGILHVCEVEMPTLAEEETLP